MLVEPLGDERTAPRLKLAESRVDVLQRVARITAAVPNQQHPPAPVAPVRDRLPEGCQPRVVANDSVTVGHIEIRADPNGGSLRQVGKTL